MLINGFNWFSPWLLASALAHGLLCWLLLQPAVPLAGSAQPTPTPIAPVTAKIVTVFAINAAQLQTQPHPPTTPDSAADLTSDLTPDTPPDMTPASQPRLSQRPTTAPRTSARHDTPTFAARRAPAKPETAQLETAEFDASQRVSAQPDLAAGSTPAMATTDVATILANVALQTAQRDISSAEIRAMTGQTQADASPRALGSRPNNFAGRDPSADVLQTFANGAQLVKVGKNCVLAALGAELRKDIHSMKTVPCDGTETDQINAHFEQVMSTVGRQR